MAYNSSLSLPDCASITSTTPCAPCFFGARISYLTFPYTITSTATVTVYPVYTGYPGSSTFVSYETDSITVTLSEDGQPIPTFGADLTWEVNGLTLTSGTTYASFANFSGAAPTQTLPSNNKRDAVTRTSTKFVLPYQAYPSRAPSVTGNKPSSSSSNNNTCVGLANLSTITLPATIDPSSFIIPVTTAKTGQFTPNVVPSQIIQYLDGLSTVVQQLGGNKLETCSPTTYPAATPIVCTYVTTISSQASASVSCETTIVDGTQTSICPASPIISVASSTITSSVNNPPTLTEPEAATSAVSKTSGLSILTETGSNRLRLPTAGVEPPSGETSPESLNNPITTPPYPGPTAQSPSPDQPASQSQNTPGSNSPSGDNPGSKSPSGSNPGSNSPSDNNPSAPGQSPQNDQSSGGNGGTGSQPNNAPSNNGPSGNTGGQSDQSGSGANIVFGTSPANQNPQGSANSYTPPPIVAQGTTYTPTPITYTSAGSAITYYPAPAVTTISGSAVSYYPTPYVSTANGAAVTYYPPAAVAGGSNGAGGSNSGGDSTSPNPLSYVPITILPTEQGCTATVTVTYSPVMVGNLTSTSAGVGDYINTGINSAAATAARQTGGSRKVEAGIISFFVGLVGAVAVGWW